MTTQLTTTITTQEHKALTAVYATAARLRQFPVPFDDHLALVDAVDRCHAVVDPPVGYEADTPPSAWQVHVDAYPRKEFLTAFREAHAALHKLWTAAAGEPGYDNKLWRVLDNTLSRFARDAGEKAGVSRSEPLL